MKIKVEVELTKDQGDTVLGFLGTVGTMFLGLPVSIETEEDPEEEDPEENGVDSTIGFPPKG